MNAIVANMTGGKVKQEFGSSKLLSNILNSRSLVSISRTTLMRLT